MSDTDVASITAASAQQNNRLGAIIGQILGNTKQIQAVSSAESGVASSEAADTRIVEQQEGTGKLQAQQGSIVAANALGTNMSDPSQIITGLSAQLLDAYGKANTAASQVADQATNHPVLAAFANALQKRGKPIGAMIGAAITGGASEQLQAQNDRVKLLSGEINDLNSTTQNIAKTQASIAPIRTVASVSAAADLAASAFTEKSLEYQQRALTFNIQGVKDVASLSQEQLGNSINVENLQLSIAQKDLQRQQIALEIQDRTDRIARNEETEAGLQNYAALVSAGLKALNPASTISLPPQKIIQIQKTQPGLFNAAAEIGMSSALNGKVTISTDPGAAAAIIQKSGATLAPAQLSVRNLLMKSYGEAHGGQVTDGLSPPKPDLKNPVNVKDPVDIQVAAAKNAFYHSAIDSISIPFANNTNIYQAPDLNSIAALPGMNGNAFVEKVIKPQLVTGGHTGTDPQALADQAVSAVQAGNIKFQDAVNGLNLTFQAAIKLNNAMKQYDSVGLVPQHSYITPLKDADGRISNVDLSDSTKITRYLSQRLLKKSDYGTLGQAMGAY